MVVWKWGLSLSIMKIKFLIIVFSYLFLTGCVVEQRSTISAPTNDVNIEKTANETTESGLSYKGEFATLGTAQSEVIIDAIKAGKNETINAVLSNPNDFTPPVLFSLADQLFEMNEPIAAMFWYYTAQLRARSDANKSLDPTVSEGLTKMNQYYGHSVGKYASSHLNELTEIMQHVIEYDELSERKYNPKWVAVLGIDSLTKSTIEFKQENEFKEIDKTTRIKFYKGFQYALKKSQNKK